MFYFFFDFTPYIAVVGDIVGSKKIQDRKAIQDKLSKVLYEVNEMYYKDIASKFMITLGDEFQGLLTAGTHALEIIEKIERQMYPTNIRFGIGVGRITTDINPDFPLGADGPAYYSARKMINELKTAEKKKMEAKADIKIEIENNLDIAELINTVFSLNTTIKAKWTKRQREIIDAYLNGYGTQSDIAQKIGINQSNVQKALANSNFYTYQKALETVTKILSNIKEKKDV
jgi:hypothetical protein